MDYVLYRFLDRDMVMRYHWGVAVGHLYTHGHIVCLQTPEPMETVSSDEELDIAVNPLTKRHDDASSDSDSQMESNGISDGESSAHGEGSEGGDSVDL